MSEAQAVVDLNQARFISLTTFRKSGKRVSTPVWVAAEDGALVVTTPIGSGKVKRLRHNSTVEMQPCGRRGKVDDGAIKIVGSASFDPAPAKDSNATLAIKKKYGLEYKIVMAIEKLTKGGRQERVILRIHPE